MDGVRVSRGGVAEWSGYGPGYGSGDGDVYGNRDVVVSLATLHAGGAARRPAKPKEGQ